MDTNDSLNTALLVTEDRTLLAGVSSLLQKAGFAVLSSRGTQAALERCRYEKMPIDLAVIDTAVAGVQPAEIVRQLHEIFPGVRMLFLSDEGDQTVQSLAPSGHIRKLLRKPFRRSKFLGEVLEMMAHPQVLTA